MARMSQSPTVLRVRQLAAAAMMAGLSADAVYRVTQARTGPYITEAVAEVFLFGLAAIAYTKRSLFGQVVARGVAWMMLVDVATAYLERGSMALWAPFCILACAVSLVLTHPLLHTDEAKAAFAPARFRRLFLAGSTATAAMAGGAFYYAAFGVYNEIPMMAGFCGLLGLTLLLAVRGLLGMRTWGALLGGLASIVCLASVPFWYLESMTIQTLGLAAAPALLLWILPILVARSTRVRVAPELVAVGAEDVRVRVGGAVEDEEELEPLEEEPRRARTIDE